jgi:hypothetical protein
LYGVYSKWSKNVGLIGANTVSADAENWVRGGSWQQKPSCAASNKVQFVTGGKYCSFRDKCQTNIKKAGGARLHRTRANHNAAIGIGGKIPLLGEYLYLMQDLFAGVVG